MDYRIAFLATVALCLAQLLLIIWLFRLTFKSSLDLLQHKAWSWKKVNLPQATLKGDLVHLKRELDEIQADPKDVVEWADALILLITSAAREGHHAGKIMDAAHLKLEEIQMRQYQGPDADGVVDHVRPAGMDVEILRGIINRQKEDGRPRDAALAAAWRSAQVINLDKETVKALVMEVYGG